MGSWWRLELALPGPPEFWLGHQHFLCCVPLAALLGFSELPCSHPQPMSHFSGAAWTSPSSPGPWGSMWSDHPSVRPLTWHLSHDRVQVLTSWLGLGRDGQATEFPQSGPSKGTSQNSLPPPPLSLGNVESVAWKTLAGLPKASLRPQGLGFGGLLVAVAIGSSPAPLQHSPGG